MAIVQQRAPGSDLAPPCRHPLARCRHRLVVEPSSCCSTAASSPPRSPDPRASAPATAAAHRGHPAAAPRGHGHRPAAYPRIRSRTALPAPAGSVPSSVGGGALELLQHCSQLTPSITRPQGQAADNRRRPPTHTPGDRHGAAAHRGHPAAAPGGHGHRPAARPGSDPAPPGLLTPAGSGPSPVGGGPSGGCSSAAS